MSNSQIAEDAELVRRFRGGDMRAFATLLERYQGPVLAYVRRMVRDAPEAEDLAQETFVRLYERLDGLTEPERLRSWLWSVASNLCRDHFRHAHYRRHASVDRDVDLERELADPRAGDAEMGRRIRRAIDGLAEDLRAVVLLRECHGLTYREIAEAVDCPVGTVRWRLHEGKKRLRAELADLLE